MLLFRWVSERLRLSETVGGFGGGDRFGESGSEARSRNWRQKKREGGVHFFMREVINE